MEVAAGCDEREKNIVSFVSFAICEFCYLQECVWCCDLDVGILVDKDNLISYQLVISYRLSTRILTNQPSIDKTIALSTNC